MLKNLTFVLLRLILAAAAGVCWGAELLPFLTRAEEPAPGLLLFAAAAWMVLLLLSRSAKTVPLRCIVLWSATFLARSTGGDTPALLLLEGCAFGALTALLQEEKKAVLWAFGLGMMAACGLPPLPLFWGGVLLYPVLLLTAVILRPAEKWQRCGIVLITLPMAVLALFLSPFPAPPEPPVPLCGLAATAMPDAPRVRVWRIGAPISVIEEVWKFLPFLHQQSSQLPIKRSSEKFDLIFLETLPPGTEKSLCRALREQLAPGGVLALPAAGCRELPELHWCALPGSRGRFAAGSVEKVPPTDPDLLDSRLHARLSGADGQTQLAPGILGGLLTMESEPLVRTELPPPFRCREFGLTLLLWFLLRAAAARHEKRELSLAAAGNAGGLVLLLLLADAHARELSCFTSTSPNWVWLGGAAALLPFAPGHRGKALCTLLVPGMLCWQFCAPSAMLPVILLALAAGLHAAADREALCRFGAVSREQLRSASFAGAAAGAALFALLTPAADLPPQWIAIAALLPMLPSLWRR